MKKTLKELNPKEICHICANTKCCECQLRCDAGSHCKLSDLIRYGDEEFDTDDTEYYQEF